MNDEEKRELTRKIVVLYDSTGMLLGQLEKTGLLTDAEKKLAEATCIAWREVMVALGIKNDAALKALRGQGEWPIEFWAKRWDSFLYNGLQ